MYEPTQFPRIVLSDITTLGDGSQASVDVTTAPLGTVSLQFNVVFVGTPTKIGPSVSPTLIVWLAVEELPQASVAVQVLINLYEPTRYHFLRVSTKVTRGFWVRLKSDTEGVIAVGTEPPVHVNCHQVGLAHSQILARHYHSNRNLFDLPVDVLPQASVAVQVLTILYEPTQFPRIVLSDITTLGDGSQASVDVTTAFTQRQFRCNLMLCSLEHH
ncbi:MAG: hypothetical protein U5L45_11005 [Saprospiraceae bacterium]|nr:hypothetical protein [Saprospiraceae bacterium]